MGEVFLTLLNMSITAGWMILVVLCVRLLFRKIPRWVDCVLWGVVAIRLVLPFSIESDFSLQPSAEPIKYNTMAEGKMLPYVPSVDSNLSIVDNAVNPVLMEVFEYQEAEGVAPLQVITEVAGTVWICGMMILLAFALGSMVRLHFLVRESVHYKDNAYICDTVKSPFILGIIRPGIYLPSDLSEDKADYIIAHERAHLKRKDHLWKPFGYLLLCIYWFNPLCWIAYIMLCKDIELACDEKVIKNMSFDDKKEYSRVLLSCAVKRHLVLICPLAFGEVGVKARVKSILNYKKPAFWITIAGIIACAIIAVCFLTNPSEEHQIMTASEESEGEHNDLQKTDSSEVNTLINDLPEADSSEAATPTPEEPDKMGEVSDYFEYKVLEDHVEIIRLKSGYENVSSIAIPAEIDGLPVTGIGDEAFFGCNSLGSIKIPDSVTSIGYSAFYECSRLSSVEIPDSVTIIGYDVFSHCSSLSSIEIPDSVTSIGEFAFYECSSLSSIEIPDSVTSIGEGAFSGCSSLGSIEIPDSVTSIGERAFSGTTWMAEQLNKSELVIVNNIVIKCSEAATDIEIPDNVTSIVDDAFDLCSSLGSIIVKKGSFAEQWAYEAGYGELLVVEP